MGFICTRYVRILSVLLHAGHCVDDSLSHLFRRHFTVLMTSINVDAECGQLPTPLLANAFTGT